VLARFSIAFSFVSMSVRIGDTIDVEGRRMRVDALDGLRVAKVWLSK
jgi:hypothetical protein